jgi:hypothetical protein
MIKSIGVIGEGHVTHMGEKRNVNRFSLGKQDAKNLLGRPPRR